MEAATTSRSWKLKGKVRIIAELDSELGFSPLTNTFGGRALWRWSANVSGVALNLGSLALSSLRGQSECFLWGVLKNYKLLSAAITGVPATDVLQHYYWSDFTESKWEYHVFFFFF